MKKLTIILLLLPLLLKSQDRKKGIRFVEDLNWEQILQKAKAEQKYIFVDAYTTWCGPCKMMETEVYINPTVGTAINEKFIAVKVQMDETAHDKIQVKKWYEDARKLRKIYAINGFPSFLFFSPDGSLLHKDIGYKDVPAFIKLVSLALNPQKPLFYNQLEAYRKGNKDYLTMGKLAIFVKNVMANKLTADTIARDYKSYLDQQPVDSLKNKSALAFINEFSGLINSTDSFFYLCYYRPTEVDHSIEFNGWADFQVKQTITREQISDKIISNDSVIVKNPDWDQLTANIRQIFNKIDAEKLVLDYQVIFYSQWLKNWQQWAMYVDKKIKAYPPSAGMQSFTELNLPAWDAFLHCNDKEILIKALEWSNLSISLNPPDDVVQELDTRANLLYKLGRIKEAIEQEEKAVNLFINIMQKQRMDKSPFKDELVATLNKMKKGLSTWPVK